MVEPTLSPEEQLALEVEMEMQEQKKSSSMSLSKEGDGQPRAGPRRRGPPSRKVQSTVLDDLDVKADPE